MHIRFTGLINQKSKCISDLQQQVQKLKSHLGLLEEQGVPQMSREISSLRSQLTKTKAEQEAMKQQNFKLQRALEEKQKV